MGSHFNYKNVGNLEPANVTGAPLSRQPSIFSLTFDEFQTTMGGGLGKDFGSMNMDELLKSICSAEDNQTMPNTLGGSKAGVPGVNLQRQGSLTLPRTLSQKTVDEVWRDLVKESSGSAQDVSGSGGSHSCVPQRQQTLGEVTLEEFLVRAGAVREDDQQIGRLINGGFYGEVSQLNNTSNDGLMFSFQQPNHNSGVVMTQRMQNSNSLVTSQPPSLALNASEIRSSHQQSQPRLPLRQQQPLFPKPANVAFASPIHLGNSGHLSTKVVNNNLVHDGGTDVVDLATGGVSLATGSPGSQISPASNTDSPFPYVFSRGRKAGAALEKVVERRQRRMIKNRESAARSRARKQAYTLELEAEVAKLKQMNQELRRKQEETLNMQKNQVLGTMKWQRGGERQSLRRTLTGPW